MIVLGLVVMTFWVSILVRTYAWIVILGNAGLVNKILMWLGLTGRPVEFLYNELGIVIGMVNVLLPFLVLPLYAAMTRVDRRLLEVAETLGAGRLRIFWQVFFPLTFPPWRPRQSWCSSSASASTSRRRCSAAARCR